MDAYVLGIDGGGTKTTVCALNVRGNARLVFETGAINLNGESSENVKKNLMNIFTYASSYFGGLASCKSVCIGAAGISNSEAKLMIENTVRESGYTGHMVIIGDHQAALYGALGTPVGIILIAGTGSICYGRNSADKEHRTGGYGYLIDDEGSGYAIGRDILAAVVRAHDGRGKATLLTGIVFEQLGVSSIEDVICFLYNKNTNKRDIAALAPNLTKAYAEDDQAAREITEKCCVELVKLVHPVVERLNLVDCTLAMAGSILQKDENIRKGFTVRIGCIYSGIVCKISEHDMSYGAALMASEYLNI